MADPEDDGTDRLERAVIPITRQLREDGHGALPRLRPIRPDAVAARLSLPRAGKPKGTGDD